LAQQARHCGLDPQSPSYYKSLGIPDQVQDDALGCGRLAHVSKFGKTGIGVVGNAHIGLKNENYVYCAPSMWSMHNAV